MDRASSGVNPDSDTEARVPAEFERFHDMLLYHDHRLLSEGRHLEVARELAARARRRCWTDLARIGALAGLIGAIFAFSGPRPGRGRTSLDVALVSTFTLLLLLKLTTMAFHWVIDVRVRRLVRHLESSPAAGPAGHGE